MKIEECFIKQMIGDQLTIVIRIGPARKTI